MNEYDGFREHFQNRDKIHEGNWDRSYRPEDIERQLVLESYGYKFLRLNRFNLGHDTVDRISKRLDELAKAAAEVEQVPQVIDQIPQEAQSLTSGDMKTCPKCGAPKLLEEYWDSSLKQGTGGFGRSCIACKQKERKPQRIKSWRGRR